MRRIVSLGLAAVIGGGLLTGCGFGNLEVTRDTIYVQKNGKVTGAYVDSLDKDYYDAEELENYINTAVSDYTSEYGDNTVKIKQFEAEEGEVKLNLKYDSVSDYVSFNGTELFSGTIAEAKSAGYEFDTEFSAVEEGAVSKDASAETVLSGEENKVIITNEAVDVKVDGTILYISKEGMSVADKSVASIADPKENQVIGLKYIIYK